VVVVGVGRASLEGLGDESSGLAIRRPPRALDRLRSPFMAASDRRLEEPPVTAGWALVGDGGLVRSGAHCRYRLGA